MNYLYLILIFFIILNLTFILNFSKLSIFHYNIDKPDNLRKLHSKPTALAGGQIIFLNIFFYFIFANFFTDLINEEIFFDNVASFNYFIAIATSIFLLGFIDDKINLKANKKFLFSLVIILCLLFLDKNLILSEIKFSFVNEIFLLNNFSIFFSLFCFLVFLNAFNMFDGINLQSSLYSLFIFLNILFFSESLFIKIMMISILSFAYLNFRNKSFLGDSGSLLLAFIISYCFIASYNFEYIEYADQICLFMLIPGLDLIRLFIIRIYKKKNPLSPDRLHLHHLLISKFPLYQSLAIIVFLISFPIFLNYLNINNIYSIFVSTLLYSMTIISIRKKY